jgi:GWxTD domain-containing protein
MFYNPGVWWISRLIRTERENCCDDVVVEATNARQIYAAALAALEEHRSREMEVVMAATGGSLVKRMRRILRHSEPQTSATVPLLSAVAVILMIGGLLAAHPAPPSPPAASVATVIPEAHWMAPPTAAVPAAARPAAQVPAEVPAQGAVQRRAQTLAPVRSQLVVQNPYVQWLDEDVVYIIAPEERAAFLGLSTDAERERFIEQFWLRRDPTPGTPENEYKNEHYRRIAYANQHFTANVGLPQGIGWRMDRGRVYIIWGAPDEIESHPTGGIYNRPAAQGGGTTTTFPFEIWLYRFIQGVGSNVVLEFVDPKGTGEFKWTTDPSVRR